MKIPTHIPVHSPDLRAAVFATYGSSCLCYFHTWKNSNPLCNVLKQVRKISTQTCIVVSTFWLPTRTQIVEPQSNPSLNWAECVDLRYIDAATSRVQTLSGMCWRDPNRVSTAVYTCPDSFKLNSTQQIPMCCNRPSNYHDELAMLIR